MDSLTFCSSKGGCFTPVGGQGFQMLKASFHDPPIKSIFFQHVNPFVWIFEFCLICGNCVRNWARDQKKLKHPKKCSGSYLRTLFLNFETPGCLCSRTPEYSLSAVFSHTEDGAGAAMGAPIVLGPWRWKSFLDTVNEPNIILPGFKWFCRLFVG